MDLAPFMPIFARNLWKNEVVDKHQELSSHISWRREGVKSVLIDIVSSADDVIYPADDATLLENHNFSLLSFSIYAPVHRDSRPGPS